MPPEFHKMQGQYAKCMHQHQQHQSGSFSTQELGILHDKNMGSEQAIDGVHHYGFMSVT